MTMSRNCNCRGGKCDEPGASDFTRREFLEGLAAAAAVSLGGQMAWADETRAVDGAAPISAHLQKYPTLQPRVYRGDHLAAVGMPIGGIGTGSIWLDGQGRLGIWQIFNNLSEPHVPDSFFAVSAKTAAGNTVTRVLQTAGIGKLQRVESLDYEGGYPIARLQFHDAELPVQVKLEALNPLIPLDTANSSIPCMLVRITASNTGTAPVDVALAAALQNAVGFTGSGHDGVRLGNYGRNNNRVQRDERSVMVSMSKSPDPVTTGPVKVRKPSGREVVGPELYWQAGMATLSAETSSHWARIADRGGVILSDGLEPEFFNVLVKLRRSNYSLAEMATVFEDFEDNNYSKWTITGTAFGEHPAKGTLFGQQTVSGFAGHGLVNTFNGGDDAQGTATSKEFRIEHRYIGFLIGGGNKPEKTCMNLLVDGKVVRTATGKDIEALEPSRWDVADLHGKNAKLEIVDKSTEGWGHISVDQIIFSDVEPDALLRHGTSVETTYKALNLQYESAESATLPDGAAIAVDKDSATLVAQEIKSWKVGKYTRLKNFRAGENGYRVVASAPNGDPLILEGPLRNGVTIIALAANLPWAVGSRLLQAAKKTLPRGGGPIGIGDTASDARIVPGHTQWGTMALTAMNSRAVALPAWTKPEEVLQFLTSFPAGALSASDDHVPAESQPGETINAALAVPMKLAAGESHSAVFAITWHFPNVERFGHEGNLYSRRWPDATGVAKFLVENHAALGQKTELYHTSMYQSNLPEEFIDAMAAQSCILRGPTCFWSENGYFGGFEGSYGCCPLNCTHVWNYAQSHARLFPEVGRNMRISNFITFLHPSGETSHREHARHNAFTDGHCACIEAAYREYQLSSDHSFLDKVWPGVKKAVDWLIAAIDAQHEGVPHGLQPNTYDCSVSGVNTFIGSQYISALASAEKMAQIKGDHEALERWRAVRRAGMTNQNSRLWNGEFYIQIPDAKPAQDYNTGCHADQLLGQWWAHMLGIGYLYPKVRVRSALEAIMKYNFREKFAGFTQKPRRYIPDDDGGLIICTWPNGGRPKDITYYSDEVWTGIEYAVAGAMVYEGMIDDARRIVAKTRSRYDGRRRDGLDSGPGGNPFNDLECGKFYARAMSSWSLLIACQGLLLEGPIGLLGFHPRWQPEDHRSFFTAPQGWGLFMQKRSATSQVERIDVRYGQLLLRKLPFLLPTESPAKVAVTLDGRAVAAKLEQKHAEVLVDLPSELRVPAGSSLEVHFTWKV